MKKNMITKITSLVLTGVLILGIGAPVSVKAGNTKETDNTIAAESMKETENRQNEENMADKEKEPAAEKSETVFVKADAQGGVSEIEVSEWLKVFAVDEVVEDVSILKNIVNVKGDEEYTVKADDMISWEYHGANISYEGTTDKELPVSVKVSYFLNDKKVKPEELAGKSGKVRIRFDYENHTGETVMVNGKEMESVVPFLMCTMLYLPTDVFSNVEVKNGKIMESEEQTIVVGMAFPGLSDMLHLEEYEPTEEIELAEYFEITADVVDFELEFTATAAITGLLEDFEVEELDEMDDMIEGMDELKDAAAEMEDGVGELLDGVVEVKGYINEYMDAVGAVDEGVGQLKDGMGALNEQKDVLKSGAAALESGITELNTALSQITLPTDGAGDGMAAGMEAMAQAAAALMQDAAALNTELTTLSDALNAMAEFTGSAESYKQQVLEKLTAIQTKVNTLDMAAANEASKSKAKEAVAQALAESGLDAETIAQIQANADEKIDAVDFTADISGKVNEIKSEFEVLPELNVPQSNISAETINALVTDMQAQLSVLETAAGGLTSAMGNFTALSGALEGLKTGVGQLAAGSTQLTAGITAYTDGVGKVYEGVTALKEGTETLASLGGEFNSGFDEMIEGIESLRDGVREFNDEGIKELTDFAGDELQNILDGIRAAKIRSDGYNNYAGIAENMKGNVVFIIETEGVEK